MDSWQDVEVFNLNGMVGALTEVLSQLEFHTGDVLCRQPK